MSTSPVPLPTIPPFTGSGVLPPFLGSDPSVPAMMSPYRTTLAEIVDRFSASAERKTILKGFLDYRAALLALGITGFQWLDGSFMEDVETTQTRAPRDIDCISFIHRPTSCANNLVAWKAFVANNRATFTSHLTKKQYLTDAYLVDLEIAPEQVVKQTAYWFGLFSHKRVTSLWKGMLQVSLQNSSDDVAAGTLLASK